MLTRLFEAVGQAPALNPAHAVRLNTALAELRYHPQVPPQSCIVTIQSDIRSFFLVYTDYKIELSDYQSVDMGAGYDHFQTFIFRYQRDGSIENQGDAAEFEETFIQALGSVIRISVSTEE